MATILRVVLLLGCCGAAVFTEPPCRIEFDCPECMPDNMPLVTSHRVTNGSVSVPGGDEATLACPAGKFLLYPLRETITVACEAGRYRVRHDNSLRHLLELGCQENFFEDVMHQVAHCPAPQQGRSYQLQVAGGGVRHVAAVCWHQDRGITSRAHVTNAPRNELQVAAHVHRAAPLSLLGNFNHMFDVNTRADAERIYSDETRLNRRLQELFKHDKFSFAGQTLTSAPLLSRQYFEDENGRAAEFVSNKIATWRSVSHGNLRHTQRDVTKLLRAARPHATLHVYTGTHDVLALRTGHSRTQVYLKPGRFPVPKYIWTVVYNKQAGKALAVTVLNDPFVAVSEIRDAVFCESACGQVPWLHELRRNRNYESPVYGLVFCCGVHNFTDKVTEMPKEILQNVPAGNDGLLLDIA